MIDKLTSSEDDKLGNIGQDGALAISSIDTFGSALRVNFNKTIPIGNSEQQVYNPCHALEVKKNELQAKLQKSGGVFDNLYPPSGLWYLQDYQNFLDDPLNDKVYHNMVKNVMAFPYAINEGTHLYHAHDKSPAVENMVDYEGQIPTHATYPFIPSMQAMSFDLGNAKLKQMPYTPDKANGTIFGVRSLVNLYAGYHGMTIGEAIKDPKRRKLTEYWLRFHNVERYGQPGVSSDASLSEHYNQTWGVNICLPETALLGATSLLVHWFNAALSVEFETIMELSQNERQSALQDIATRFEATLCNISLCPDGRDVKSVVHILGTFFSFIVRGNSHKL